MSDKNEDTQNSNQSTDASQSQTSPKSKTSLLTQTLVNKHQQDQKNNLSSNNKDKKQQQEVQKMLDDLKITQQQTEKGHLSQSSNSPQEQKITEQPNQLFDQTKYFVQINKQSIEFGKTTLFPGSIQQVQVSIGLKQQTTYDHNHDNQPYMLRVIAKCNNVQFDALDQYVFSVRSIDRFQYFEEVRFKTKKKQRVNVKVAVKIPPSRQNCLISGVLQVQLEGLKPVYLPISAKCEIPQILCMKDLYKVDEQLSMIKVPAKKNQIRMPPIPFKNLSNFNFALEIETISNQSFLTKPYDVICQSFINCSANMQFFVNLQLKQNINFKGTLPTKQTIRKILILKIKNTPVYFSYPLEINVYESTNSGGMS